MKTDMNSDLSSYYNGDDLKNPNFLYLGSPNRIDFDKLNMEIMTGYRSNFKMYLTAHYNTAIANAFAQKLIEKNPDKAKEITVDSYSIPILKANGVEDLDDNAEGYLYIFECPEDAKNFKKYDFIVDGFMMPIKTKEFYYKDHKVYFSVNQETKKLNNM